MMYTFCRSELMYTKCMQKFVEMWDTFCIHFVYIRCIHQLYNFLYTKCIHDLHLGHSGKIYQNSNPQCPPYPVHFSLMRIPAVITAGLMRRKTT